MPLPDPHPGLVLSYSYLWADEYRAGGEDGRKDRPCAIVLTRQVVGNHTLVTVVPITHSPPANAAESIEIPPKIKAHLGLDHLPSWIIISEVNDFIWPRPDLRHIPSSGQLRFDYGVLPPGFFRQVRDRLLALVAARRVANVPRSE